MIRRLRLLVITSNPIIKTPSFPSIHNFSSPITFVTHNNNNNNKPPQNSIAATRSPELAHRYQTFLTPQIVQSTLLSCPSDLIAFSFFLWCAKQPNYFHHRLAFDHMVNLVARLTQQFKTAKAIIEQLERVGVVTKPQTLLLLLRIYWRGGMRMYDMVFEVFDEMLQYGYTPNTYARNIVMDVWFKRGRVNEALRVLKETQAPNFLTFSIAMCNLCKLNDFINIQDVLRSMLRRGYYLNADHFPMVLNCFCKLGKLAEALQLLGVMITMGGNGILTTTCVVWSILIDGLLKSGRLVMATHLFEKMVEAVGCAPNVVTCTSLIKGFLESHKPTDAFAILNTLESRPDLVLCNVLIDGLSKIGRYDDALDVFFSLPKRKLVPDSYTFSSLISTVCLSRQFALLPILVNGYVIEPDLVVCNSILNYFCKAGYSSGAVKFYIDMIVRGFIPDRYSYVGLLSGLCGAGRIDKAVNVYQGIVTSNHFDAHVHTVIMDGLIKSRNFHTAVRLFRRAVAQKYQLDVVAYTVAINGLVRGGRSWEAYTLYSQMKDVGVVPSTSTCSVMLRGFCRERDVKMIEQILREMIDRGTELDCSTFNMTMRMLETRQSRLYVHHLFLEFCESGLISNKALCAQLLLLVNGLTNGGDEHHLSLKGNMEKIPDVSLSSSEDLSDVAASLG